MKIYCINCNKDVNAINITGKEAYKHRPDLYSLKFYQCPICGNFVGVHKDSGLPLGSIPTKEIKKARMEIHSIIDPLWKSKKIKRGRLYGMISGWIKKKYHSAEINSLEDAIDIIGYVKGIKYEVEHGLR